MATRAIITMGYMYNNSTIYLQQSLLHTKVQLIDSWRLKTGGAYRQMVIKTYLTVFE